jgi:hypothetical protein
VLLVINNASARETQRQADKWDAAPTMQGMIGAACQLPGETLGRRVGDAPRVCCECWIVLFIESHDTYL